MDPFTLEITITLSSRVHPDWLSAIHVLRPSRRQGIDITYKEPLLQKLSILQSSCYR